MSLKLLSIYTILFPIALCVLKLKGPARNLKGPMTIHRDLALIMVQVYMSLKLDSIGTIFPSRLQT